MKRQIINTLEWITFIPNAPIILSIVTYMFVFKIGFEDTFYLTDDNVVEYVERIYPTWLSVLVATTFYIFIISHFIQ
jgi:uncharacterized membrane protein